MVSLMFKLLNTLGYIIALAFFFTRLKNTRNIFTKEKLTNLNIFCLTFLFSALSILGTYIGFNYKGAIANTRNIGIVVGGVLGGPQVAILTGIIAGLHRYIIDIGSFTNLPCAIATIIGGFFMAYIYPKMTKHNRSTYAFISGCLIENLSMLLILIMSSDKLLALDVVKNIYLPMVLINGVGACIVVIITENIFEENDIEAGRQARLALEIANKTLPLLKKGGSLEKVCEIVRTSLNAKLVVLTDKEFILASSAISQEYNIDYSTIKSEVTKKVLRTGEILVYDRNTLSNEDYLNEKDIQSCIIAPLFQEEKISGTLKIYFDNKEDITARKQYLAIGLSQLISTQLEISKMEEIKNMARESELKFLQGQINPHFLFNALNTIASFVRFNPNKAREIIIDLSTYLRYNLENTQTLVSLEKELEQVKAYVNIEKARFHNKFDVFYNIETDISEIKIPSLIIQPLVENSIKHGILPQREFGIVNVNIKKFDINSYSISIIDNGVGIKEEVISSINTEIKNNIGLKNVHNRLKILYGSGLKIIKLKQGTKISFIVK